ncbi:MAG: mechanosensitive ion channel [Pirellulales bacterium]|nr:mechanosensitive ion channel [Pirellulales bacterium]
MCCSPRSLRILMLAAAWLAAGTAAWAQPTPAPPAGAIAQPSTTPAAGSVEVPANGTPPAPPTEGEADEAGAALWEPHNKAWLAERIARLETLGLAEEDKKAALASYQEALESRATTFRFRDQIKAYRKELEERDGLLEKGKAQFAAPLPSPSPLPTTLPELEARVLELEQQSRDLAARRDEAAAKLKARGAMIGSIPKQITDTQTQLRKLEEQIAGLASGPVEGEVEAAAIVALVNRRQALQETILKLQQEQLVVANSELVQLELDMSTRELAALDKQLTQARTERNRLQQAEADRQAREAAQAAEVERPKPIAALADRNAALAAQRKELTAKLTALATERGLRESQRAALQKDYDNTRARIDASGLGISAGNLLLRQKNELPNVRDLRNSAADRLDEVARLTFENYGLVDEQAALANVDGKVESLLAALEGQRVQEAEVRRLLDDQRKFLNDLVEDTKKYGFLLNTVAAEEEALAALATEYGEYIAQRVLWIRNAPAMNPWEELPLAADAARWSLDPRKWREAGDEIAGSFQRHPTVSALAILAILVVMFLQRRARRGLREAGAVAAKRTCAEFQPTLRALAYTVLIALPWPALLWFVGWSLDNPGGHSDFVQSLSGSTRIVAWCLLLLEVLRALCRGAGLADAHFEWPEPCLAQIRRHARWLTAAGLPLVLWTAGLDLQQTEPLYSSSLGRMCFIALMLLLAYLLERMLMGRKSPFRQLLSGDRGWLAPLEHVWRPATVLLPAALAVLAATGYYFSAQQAAVRLVQSVVLMLAVLAAGGLTRRLLLVNRRSLAREQAKQRRAQLAAAAAAAAASAAGEGESSSPVALELPTADLVEETVDLAALSEQTQKLVRTCLALATAAGLYLIWRELLPAVAYLSERSLLPGFALTWAQALQCAVVLAITYVAVRDIPALLELAILQRLPLDSGSRYALTSITRYLLCSMGIVMAYKSLGYTGENIQWLVAAMGVGLGFGLQEIFANFVSGIILLFERPIRVGDVITLGDKTGAVTRIRMRATTIVDWDRKEYIVPNKHLVTEKLLNWTLSDQTNRLMVNVGVAYGSDTELACRLLVEAAREQPAVLVEPAPVAAFEGFGDSSLNLSLRAYLPSLENRLATIHGLHTTIDRKFRAAGLEIPFPQRDLNLRHVPPGWLAAADREAPGLGREPVAGLGNGLPAQGGNGPGRDSASVSGASGSEK